jgi:opine dehydrogenase
MKIAIIGAGNGGQAMAGHFGYLGHEVRLYSRNLEKLKKIIYNKGVLLKEKLNGLGRVDVVTDEMAVAVQGAELIMVTTVANAHATIAYQLAPLLEEGQTIVLNPGRTFGALEFRTIIEQYSSKKVYIAETQSLLYACRAEGNGEVRIIGVKDKLPVAAYPSKDTDVVLENLTQLSNSFIKATNIFETSLENIGCIFHPAIVLFNAATIERGDSFYFYSDMTPSIASFIEAIDKERLAIGEKLNVKLLSVFDWISFSYKEVTGDTLYERMMNNPAYYKIMAPNFLNSRLLTEDIPTGVLPLIEIAQLLDIKTPLLTSVYNVTAELLKTDFRKTGRTLKNLGLDNIDIIDLINCV